MTSATEVYSPQPAAARVVQRMLVHPALLAYVGVYVSTLLAAAVMPSPVLFGGFLVASWTALLMARILFMGPVSEVDAVFVLWLAAGQNVLIGALVTDLSADHVRVLIGTNFLLGALWVSSLGIQRFQAMLRRRTLWMTLALPGMALLLVSSLAVFGFNGMAALASARNVLTPILFFVVGWLIGWRRSDVAIRTRFMRAIVWLGVAVVLLGLVERFALPDAWSALNVGELWTKKGLTNVAASGLPRNWISAEQIAGAPIRRMVSTFADPVNLGTFLLLFTLCGYGLRLPLVVGIGVVGIILTVSKGGLLGCLVFGVTYAYYRWSRLGFLAVGTAATGLGLAFIAYSARYASRSMFVHIGGTVAAVVALPEYPLGMGVGRVGTMANQFVELGDQDIRLSGLGVIAGQLGVPGVLLYVIFLGAILAAITSGTELRERIVAVTLFWSITLNIAFNEVALSPNSSAGYFLLLGLIASAAQARRRAEEGRPRPLESGSG